MPFCPEATTWLRLLREEVTPAERAELEIHLESCPMCPEVLADLIEGRDVVDPSLLAQGITPGPDTLAMLAAVAGLPRLEAGRRVEDDGPVAPPEIPGLVDWEYVGRGGMGVVFRAREVALDRPVAVKVLASGKRIAQTARARAIREARLMASLKHPNVVQVHRTGETDGMPFLVMEWIDGGTLWALVQDRGLTIAEAAGTVRALALAVAEAHALGIIHRDLKPENVLLTASEGHGPGIHPKLNDFGLARRGEEEGLTETGFVLGTPGYMAPEQTGFHAACGGEVGPATDIHGLGAILYACLAGQAPYAGLSRWESLVRSARATPLPIKERRGDVPRDLTTIVDKCLQATPSRRYRSAGELADDLGRFLEGRPVLARPISIPERGWKWARRRPALAASASFLVVAAVVAMAGMALHVAAIDRAYRATDRAYRATDRAYRDLAAEQAKTRVALSTATAARDQARRALTSLSDDVVRRLLERGSVLDPTDRAFLEKVRGFFLDWPVDPDPETALRFRGDGLGRLGDLFEQVSRYDEARTCRREAIESYDEAIRRGLAGPEVVEARLNAMVLLHQTLSRMKRFRDAEALARRLISERGPLARTDVVHRRKLARDYIRLGDDLGWQGRDEEATASFRQAIARLERLKGELPRDEDIREAELRAYFLQAARSRGKAAGEVLYRTLVDRAEEGLALAPRNEKFIQYEVSALIELVAATRADRPGEAALLLRRRMELARLLVADHPDNQAYRGDLLLGAAQLFQVCAAAGRPGDAEPDLESAVAEGARMVAAEPAVFDRAKTTAVALVASAELFEVTGRLGRAIERWDRAAAILEPWIKSGDHAPEVLTRLREARNRSVILAARLGDHRASARYMAAIIDHCQPRSPTGIRLLMALELGAAGDYRAACAEVVRVVEGLRVPPGRR